MNTASIRFSCTMRCTCIANGGTSNISASNKCSEKLPEYAATRGQFNANARCSDDGTGTERKASAVMATSFGKRWHPAWRTGLPSAPTTLASAALMRHHDFLESETISAIAMP